MPAAFGLGLVGVNDRARKVVLPGFMASPHCHVVALCSRDRTKAREVAQQVGAPHVFDDYTAMLDSPGVDAVFLNVPNQLHFPMAMQAIEARKHVICEKPLADTVEQAAKLTDAATAAGVRTAVNFTLRSLPGPRTVSRLLADGAIGTLTSFELATMQSRGFEPKHARANGLADLGPHVADLLAWWAKDVGAGEVSSVAASLSLLEDRQITEADGQSANVIVQAVLRLSGNATGYLGMLRVAPGFGNAYRATLYGTKATLEMYYDTEAPRLRMARGIGQFVADAWEEIPIPDDLNVTYAEFPRVHFGRIASAIAGEGSFPDFRDGLRSQRLLDAVAHAGHAHSWVSV